MREGSTEYAIFVCFELGMWAINPLIDEERLSNPELNLPISFFYGDLDWMDSNPGHQIVEANMYGGDKKISSCYIVNNSDHHMYIDNPEEFARLIIHDI